MNQKGTKARRHGGTESREPESASPRSVGISVPVVDPGAGYRTEHVEVQGMAPRQREGLKWLLTGLMQAGAVVRSPVYSQPRQVKSAADAVKWLLEEIGRNIETPKCQNAQTDR